MKLRTVSILILSVTLLTACMPGSSVISTPTEGVSNPARDTVTASTPTEAIPPTGGAPAPTRAVPAAVSTPEPAHLPPDLTPAQRAAMQALAAQHNVAIDQIKLVSAYAETWPDGCLGVAIPDMMCTQALVDGYRILLSANGQEYEYRTNLDGTLVIEATQPLLAP